jgi:predicted nucleotide-binding protein
MSGRTEKSVSSLVHVTNRKAVMVIYGHDREANNALFGWLRSIGLQPQEWSQLIQLSGSASPYIGQVLDQAFEHVQAVVAFFTPDEHVRSAGSRQWRLQARPNVLIEAGMALVTHPERTVFVTLGSQQLPSDLTGRHYVRLDGTSAPLHEIASLLRNAGCEVDTSGADWLDHTRFPSRDNPPSIG